jgi:hypothetical protein
LAWPTVSHPPARSTVAPAQRQQLPHPQTGEGQRGDHRFARDVLLVALGPSIQLARAVQQCLDLFSRLQVAPLGRAFLRSAVPAACRVAGDQLPLHGVLHDRAEDGEGHVHRAGRKALAQLLGHVAIDLINVDLIERGLREERNQVDFQTPP